MDMDGYGEPINHCLCRDQLSDPKTPWKVKPKVVENMKKWWNSVTTATDDETRMNDDLYEDMIARFFGPATQSKLKFKDDQEETLPKILAEAVSLTGDLYSSNMLDKDKEEVLKHPISFLVGPPNTGKTRMLTLAGNKWLSEGHDVFIVKDATSKTDPFLSQHLKGSIERKVKKDGTQSPHVFDEKCDLTSKESIEECVNRIINKKPRNENELICILLDVAHLKGKYVNNFDETLHRLSPSSNLWVSCSRDMSPSKGYVMKFKQILNCPPVVVREALKVSNERNEDVKHAHDYLRPTDGPPVKHINYNLSVASPQESRELGMLVGEFLAEDLCVTRTDKPEWSKVQALPLTHKDIFILFESSTPINEESKFLEGLRDKSIRVQAVKIEDDNVVVDERLNTAWAMNVCHMQLYRMKRKIVVYVQSYFNDKENKQRAITSCTSQLILVQPKARLYSKASSLDDTTCNKV
ncbi:uncharacterized protein LOC112574759 isoform X2 [Pomacea canaliculata]|nr:uncharacterized protein LOC112574759 isoform X2 [Pomacea canaliculata]